jgi:hypothetical protein
MPQSGAGPGSSSHNPMWPVDNRTLAGTRTARVRLTTVCGENLTRAVRKATSVRFSTRIG